MRSDQQCAECAQLWEDFARATTEFFRLEDEGKLAALTRDRELVARLLIEGETAAKACARAREAFNEHRTATHHYEPIGEAARL